MRTITLVLLSILIAACAARQRAPTPGPGPASNAAPEGGVAASAPAGTTPPPAAPVADHPADNSNVPDPDILKHGYKVVQQNGQLLYCRSQILTGTHFPNTICLTEAQVKASDRGKQEALDQLGKAGGSDCRIYKCN